MTKKAVMIMMIVFLLIGAGSGFIVGEVLNKDTQENAQEKKETSKTGADEKNEKEQDRQETKQVRLYFLEKNVENNSVTLKPTFSTSINLTGGDRTTFIKQAMEALIKGPTNYTHSGGTHDQALIPIIPGNTKVRDVEKSEQPGTDGRTIVTYTVTLSEDALKDAKDIIEKVNQPSATSATSTQSGGQKSNPKPADINNIGDKVFECLKNTILQVLKENEEVAIQIENYETLKKKYSQNNYWEKIIGKYISPENPKTNQPAQL